MAVNYGTTALNSAAIFSLPQGADDAGAAGTPLVMTPSVTTGDNVGYDTLYIGATCADGNMDLTTLIRVNETDADAGAQSVITTDGTSMDVREHFAVGDTLHGHDGSGTDDVVLGEVLTVDTATQFTLTAGTTGALREDDFVYNVNPITLRLGFEK